MCSCFGVKTEECSPEFSSVALPLCQQLPLLWSVAQVALSLSGYPSFTLGAAARHPAAHAPLCYACRDEQCHGEYLLWGADGPDPAATRTTHARAACLGRLRDVRNVSAQRQFPSWFQRRSCSGKGLALRSAMSCQPRQWPAPSLLRRRGRIASRH